MNWQILVISLGSVLITAVSTNYAAVQHRSRRREVRRETYTELLGAVIALGLIVEEVERQDNVRFLGGTGEENDKALARIVGGRLNDSQTDWERERRRGSLALARLQIEGPDDVATAAKDLLGALVHRRTELRRWPDHLAGTLQEGQAPPNLGANVNATQQTYQQFLNAARRVLKTE